MSVSVACAPAAYVIAGGGDETCIVGKEKADDVCDLVACAARPMGIRETKSSLNHAGISLFIVVASISDGDTQFTRIPNGASSLAQDLVKPITAALDDA